MSSALQTKIGAERRHRRARGVGPQLLKWAVFGVMLPLLPIGGRLAAAWLNGKLPDIGFADLFGDGELLVLATVIAAAGIGDVIFDSRRTNGNSALDGRPLRAVVVAGALVVVVLSVLFFGLVTFEKEARGNALDQARVASAAQRSQAQGRLEEARAQELKAASLDRRRKALERQVRTLRAQAAAEASGRGGSGISGAGPMTRALRSEIDALERRSRSLGSEARRRREQASRLTSEASEHLAVSVARANRGQAQAALASLLMFLLSLPSGALCVAVAHWRAAPE